MSNTMATRVCGYHANRAVTNDLSERRLGYHPAHTTAVEGGAQLPILEAGDM